VTTNNHTVLLSANDPSNIILLGYLGNITSTLKQR
jgi:hypothetical protein